MTNEITKTSGKILISEASGFPSSKHLLVAEMKSKRKLIMDAITPL